MQLFSSYSNFSIEELTALSTSLPWDKCDSASRFELKQISEQSHYIDHLLTLNQNGEVCHSGDMDMSHSELTTVIVPNEGPTRIATIEYDQQPYLLIATQLDDSRYLFGLSKCRKLLALMFPEANFPEGSSVTLTHQGDIIGAMGETLSDSPTHYFDLAKNDLRIELEIPESHLLDTLLQTVNYLLPASLFTALAVTPIIVRFRSFRGQHLKELLRTLRNKEFYPVFQPIVDGHSKQVLGHELLARWQHPKWGAIPPDHFIPILAHHGQLDRLLLELVSQCQNRPQQHQYLSINLSGEQLTDNNRNLGEFLRELCLQLGLDTHRVIIEITERDELDFQSPGFQSNLNDIRQCGFKVAIDDFGTGHNGLTGLRQFQPDFLKVDKGFIQMIRHRDETQPVLDSIFRLAQQLGITVIAEGVETEEQRQYLLSRDVVHMQGYLFGKPHRRPAQRLDRLPG
ncbi:EAL domain-containing protein [Ferrimonas sediminum]|uniref:EAL domain-containing protein n=1 Tax=Ferrimonas sediminum TaxID=718193 RepID=UPI0015A2C25F|nr:EAL domain-containing protein [Ferrimonas sediminum]